MQGNLQQVQMLSSEDKKFMKLLQILERLDPSSEGFVRQQIIEELRELV